MLLLMTSVVWSVCRGIPCASPRLVTHGVILVAIITSELPMSLSLFFMWLLLKASSSSCRCSGRGRTTDARSTAANYN